MGPELTANTVIYDGECPLCVTLAQFLSRRSNGSIHYRAYATVRDEFQQARPDSLLFWTGTEMVAGPAAWEKVLSLDPSIASLNWLAQRLKLVPETSHLMQRAGSVLRHVCPRCPRPTLR